MKTKIIKKIFTRLGGVSHEPYDSLNVRFGIGDNKDDVLKNRKLICEELRIELEQLVSLNQIHSDRILYVDKMVKGEIDGYDAMITNKKGIFLMIQVADCQAVCMYDPEKKAVANTHNGWKGSAQNIVGKTIRKMEEQFGCDPADILVGISPSLGPCHSEFSDPYKELPVHLQPYILKNNHVDFWEATADQCTSEGVLKENIEVSEICTVCDDDYFSYRKSGGKTGRFAVIIGIP